MLGDDVHIVAALSAGAQGYLLKEQARPLLVRHLQQAREGIPALSPSVARRIMDHFQKTGPTQEADMLLTGREQEVLALISRGLRNAEVARALGLQDSTIASYIKTIYRKLNISSRAEATLCATRLGLASLPLSRP